MMDGKNTFDVLSSIDKHIEALKPLLPKQAMVCIGEYPIKTLLRTPIAKRDGTLPIFIEKSSEDIYKWIPKGFDPFFVLGYEDQKVDTHFWYNIHETVLKDNSVIKQLKKKPTEQLRSAIIFSSLWDGVGSATLPTLISKFKNANIDSLSIAILPSKVQPSDAHFNAYASMQLCSNTEGSTLLLLDRDQIDSYEGVDRKGQIITGNQVVNYLLNLFLDKESLVSEISELSRTFNVKFFSSIAITGASLKIYGSLENMLNTAWLKPLLQFDLPSASLLFVLLRLPTHLKDKLPRAKIELAITNWFKDKTTFQSTFITEPIYTNDINDRIDAVLFLGGFDMTTFNANLQRKTARLKNRAVEKGFMTQDWQVITPRIEEPESIVESPQISNDEDLSLQENKTGTTVEKLSESAPALDEPIKTGDSQTAQLSIQNDLGEQKAAKSTGFLGLFKKLFNRRKKTEKVVEQKQDTSA